MNGDETWTPLRGRLRGQRVAICAISPGHGSGEAGVAAAYRSSPTLETEETVISFLRAVLAEGARVTLIADEPLALLAAMVAGEYVEPFLEEQRERPPAPLTIVTEPRREDDAFEHLQTLGHASVENSWTVDDAVERIGPDTRAVLLAGRVPSDTVERMRKQAPGAAFYAIAASGVEVSEDILGRERITFIDEVARSEYSLAPREERQYADERPPTEPEQEPEFEYPPIALAAQIVVQRIIDDTDNEPSNEQSNEPSPRLLQ